MRMVDWVIKNGRVITEQGVIPGGLAVKGERIVALGSDEGLPPAQETYDAQGAWVIPGGVDTHVHIHYASEVWRGDFGSETTAALLGGTTTVAEFAHGGEPGLLESFAAKKEAGETLSVTDFALHAVFRAEADLEAVPAVLDKGVLSVKAMLADPNGIKPILSGLLVELFKMVGEAGGMMVVHAENEEIQAYLRRRLKSQGQNGPLAHALSRPEISEGEGISRSILFARHYSVPLHIFHLTSELGRDLIADAQARGQLVTAETCPHYLLFTRDDVGGELGPFLQVNPSIKLEKDRAALWAGLRSGVIDAVVSDHYAPKKMEKERGWENIWEVEGGVPGVESRLPVLWQSGVETGRLSPERFVEVTATRPAQIFGLYPKKGVLQVGSDADVVVWDPDHTWTLNADTLHHTADWTPFASMEIHGYPRLVFLRGKLAAREGELLVEQGYGQFVPRSTED
ncbi:MAG: dihydroorotase [Anaerolineae bacterium]